MNNLQEFLKPSVEGKMTMYKADISHAAVISSNVDFRWSHTFAFSDDFPPEVTMGDLRTVA